MAEVVCFILTTNHASRQVMEEVRFEYERDIVHVYSMFYCITTSAKKKD